MRTVVIEIQYLVIEINNRVARRGSFLLNGKKPEQIARQFWEELKKESPLELKLFKVVCENEDITEFVREAK